MRHRYLVGMDFADARKKLGVWYVLTSQKVIEGTKKEYTFYRGGNAETVIVRTEDGIVTEVR